MNRKLNRKIYLGVFVAIAIIVIGPTGMNVVSGQEATEKQEVKVDIQAGEEYVNPKSQNLGQENKSDVETNTDAWTRDYGGEDKVPRGVYRGPLFESSLMELDYNPRYRWRYGPLEFYPYGDTPRTSGKIGSTSIIQTTEFSSSRIMNGASELYIQVPVSSKSLKVMDLKTENVGDSVRGKYYSSIHIYKGEVDTVDVKMNDTAICQDSTASIGSSSGVKPQAVVPITPDDYKNGRPYVKVNTLIESDITYTFIFNLITGGEKPELFITDSQNFQTIDIQYNYEDGLATYDRIDKGNSMLEPTYDSTPSGNVTMYADRPEVYNHYHKLYDDYKYEKDLQETNFHLGTSFIFTSGIGNHYMFGKEFHMEAGETLEFYPDIDWSEYNSTTDHTSFYLPFMSENELGNSSFSSSNINIGVSNHEIGAGDENYDWRDPDWNWQNFILYSSPKEWGSEGEEGADIISIYFNESATLTIPFTARELDYDYYDDDAGGSIPYETKDLARWRDSRLLKSSEMNRYVNWKTPNYHEEFDYQDKEFFFYTPYIKAELTEDVWAQVDTDGKGRESYSHAFEPTAYYSNKQIELVDKSNQTSSWEKTVDLLSKGFKYTPLGMGVEFLKGNNPINQIASDVKGGANKLIKASKRFAGYLYDGLMWIWQGIKEVFNIIYNAVMDFVGWITNIFEDIANVLGTLAKRVAYIAGMLGFVFLMAGTSKVVKLTEWSG